MYLSFLRTWTVKDPLKRHIVKENNLNWLEFFNMNDFLRNFKSTKITTKKHKETSSET